MALVPGPEKAELHGTRLATAGSRADAVSLSVCRLSSCTCSVRDEIWPFGMTHSINTKKVLGAVDATAQLPDRGAEYITRR